MTPAPLKIRVPFCVPYIAQIASPELAWAYWVDGYDIRADPRWAESGADSIEEYTYWADRACGPACVKMCVEALGGPVQPLLHWVRAGLALDGYIVREDTDGMREEIGWAHRALAALIEQAGFSARAKAASPDEIVEELRAECLVIASVSPEIGATGPITRRGGHLVVISGADVRDGAKGGAILSFTIHNPSGRIPLLQANAHIPAARFAAAYSHRIITASRNH